MSSFANTIDAPSSNYVNTILALAEGPAGDLPRLNSLGSAGQRNNHRQNNEIRADGA